MYSNLQRVGSSSALSARLREAGDYNGIISNPKLCLQSKEKKEYTWRHPRFVHSVAREGIFCGFVHILWIVCRCVGWDYTAEEHENGYSR